MASWLKRQKDGAHHVVQRLEPAARCRACGVRGARSRHALARVRVYDPPAPMTDEGAISRGVTEEAQTSRAASPAVADGTSLGPGRVADALLPSPFATTADHRSVSPFHSSWLGLPDLRAQLSGCGGDILLPPTLGLHLSRPDDLAGLSDDLAGLRQSQGGPPTPPIFSSGTDFSFGADCNTPRQVPYHFQPDCGTQLFGFTGSPHPGASAAPAQPAVQCPIVQRPALGGYLPGHGFAAPEQPANVATIDCATSTKPAPAATPSRANLASTDTDTAATPSRANPASTDTDASDRAGCVFGVRRLYRATDCWAGASASSACWSYRTTARPTGRRASSTLFVRTCVFEGSAWRFNRTTKGAFCAR